jgi:hypothetical protein
VCLCSVEAQKTCVAGEVVLSSGLSEACILPLCMFSAIFPVEFWTDPSHKGLGECGWASCSRATAPHNELISRVWRYVSTYRRHCMQLSASFIS